MANKKLVVSVALEFVGDEQLVWLMKDLMDKNKDLTLINERMIWDYDPDQHYLGSEVEDEA